MTIRPELLDWIAVRVDGFGGKPNTRDMRVDLERLLGVLPGDGTT